MVPRSMLSRLVAITGSAVLLASLVVAPAAARAPSGERGTGPTIDRGRVVAADAAKAARGSDRTRHELVLPAQRPSKGGKVAPSAFSPTTPGISPLLAGAEPRLATEFSGIGENADNLNLEPPDPWVAVSSTHVLQSTNGLIRITSRSGVVAASIPTWSLFALLPWENDADPRFVWDAAKSRFVGVLLSFSLSDDFTTVTEAYVNVAVSETADPLGAWRIYAYGYTDGFGTATLPDYPGIATSGDKIVITANEFTAAMDTYVGGSILVLRWSDVVAGVRPEPVLWTVPDPLLFSPRPAINQSATNDVHLVGFDDGSGLFVRAKLSGTAPAAPTWTAISSMSAGFCATTAPNQPGSPATIARGASDGRATDAVHHQGKVAFVSTCSVSGDNSVRVSIFDAATGTATHDDLIRYGGSGVDAYMGGIGYAQDGTLFATWTESSTTDYASAYAAAYVGGGWYFFGGPTESGTATYQGTRWGDYVGVAQDPSGTGAVWTSVEVPDDSGDWRTVVQRLVSDTTAPVVTKAPTQALVTGTQLGAYTIPVKLGWTATDAGSGVARTVLSLDRFDLGYVDAGSSTGSSATRANWWKDSGNTTNYRHTYAAQAVDAAGNVSPTVEGATLTPVVYEQGRSQFTFGSGWRTTTGTKYSGESAKYSSTVGASVTFRTSGRSFGFISTRASTRGKVKVYVDGTYKGTVTLTSSTTSYRRLMYTITFSSTATHTIKLVVRSGRVDVDAFVVLK